MEHIKQGCCQSILLWKEGVQNVVLEDTLLWGWLQIEEVLMPKYHSNKPLIFAVRVHAPLDAKVFILQL